MTTESLGKKRNYAKERTIAKRLWNNDNEKSTLSLKKFCSLEKKAKKSSDEVKFLSFNEIAFPVKVFKF